MKNKAIIILGVFFLVISGYLVYYARNIDNSGFESVEIRNVNSEKSSIYDLRIDSSVINELYVKFPYAVFIRKANYSDMMSVASYLDELDSITRNSFMTQNILSTALTSRLDSVISTDNEDSLKALLDFAEKYRIASLINSRNQAFYHSVYDYWYNNVVNRLSNKVKYDNDFKYSFKYRYLKQRCEDKGYFIDSGNSNFEKIVFYLIDNKWSYLFNRAWNSTSIIVKILLLIIVSMNIILIVFGFRYILKK